MTDSSSPGRVTGPGYSSPKPAHSLDATLPERQRQHHRVEGHAEPRPPAAGGLPADDLDQTDPFGAPEPADSELTGRTATPRAPP